MDAKLPPPLLFEGNIAENYRKFKQAFDIYMVASEKNAKPDEVKIAILLNTIGEEAVEIFNNFSLVDNDKKDYKKVIEEFEKYMNPKKNLIYERFRFYNRKQENGEPFDMFLQDVTKLSKNCEFKDTNDMVRDRLVLGVNDKVLQEKLLGQDKLTLTKCMELCRANEVTKSQLKNLQENTRVDEIKSKKNKLKNGDKEFYCRRCKSKHKPKSCPAYGKKCEKCGRFNHLAAACRSRIKKKVADIGEDGSTTSDDQEVNDLFVYGLTVSEVTSKPREEWAHVVNVENRGISFKLDSGSEVSILRKEDLEKITEKKPEIRNKMKQTFTILEAYGGTKIKPLGKIKLTCMMRGKDFIIDFIVVDSNCKRSILGLSDCTRLNLIRKVEMVNCAYTNVKQFVTSNEIIFKGVGKFKDKCTIKLKKDCKPIALPPRRVPGSIRKRLKLKLADLASKGIISKVNEPAEWLSNLVIMEKKNNDLRICLDPQELNKVIDREYYLIPTLEDIAMSLKGKSVFTVLDLKEGFYQVELDEESSKLCSFNSPYGSYKFNRLAFGLNLAPEWFQKINEKYFGDIEGVTVYFDDLIIAANSYEAHDKILSKVVQRATEQNVKFNKKKIQFKQPSVKYLGQIFDSNGMRCDEDKLRAIKELEPPKDVKQLQSILGMINYLRAYIPNLAELTAPLRLLLKKGSLFTWLPIHSIAFDKIKEIICKAPVLSAFDSGLLPVIQTDSSKDGIGSVLLQAGRPVAFSSRSLTDTEKEYAQIEKELLAVVHAVNKFHLYVYGRKFKVISDHKPLVSIMNKPISKISNHRLQRLKLKLVKYDFELVHKPGKELHIADLLSRNYIKDPVEDDVSNEEMVHSVSVHLRMSESKKAEFKKCTQEDEELCKLVRYCNKGWPTSKKNVSHVVDQYWNLQNDIYVSDDLVFYKDRVIVPCKLRSNMLALLHEGHFGATKTKLRAKEIMFWPNINKQIEDLVKNCTICENYRPANANDLLMPHEIPNSPFQKVSADILDFAGKSYIVIMDYYSKWLELMPLKGKTARDVVKAFKIAFSCHGIPSIVISDNMPFNSYECKKFAKSWDFQIVTSSPHHSRSNGQAESGVKIAKTILRKNTDMYGALLEYRSTPLPSLNVSPAQLLFSRRLKTKLPIAEKLLNPTIQNENEIANKLKLKQMLYKNYFDKTAKSLEELEEGDNVLINTNTNKNKEWERGKIVKLAKEPRSYIVKTSTGNTVRRSRQHLRKSSNETLFSNIRLDQNDASDNCNSENCDSKVENFTSDARPIRLRNLPLKYKDFVMS